MRDLIKMVVVLTVICGASGLVLSYANKITKAPRQYQLLKYVQEPSIKAVLGSYDNDPIKERIVIKTGKDEKGRPLEKNIFPANPDGKIMGLSIMTHTETPGLGARIVEPAFTDKFKGLSLSPDLNLTAKGGKIDGVSGATHSSEGVVEAVRKALELFPEVKKEVG